MQKSSKLASFWTGKLCRSFEGPFIWFETTNNYFSQIYECPPEVAQGLLQKAFTISQIWDVETKNKKLNIPHCMLTKKTFNPSSAFTLVEIMIVVAIIALLAAIAVPNFLRARKRSQATRILEDLRIIDSATDQYAIESYKSTGDPVAWTDIQVYLKTGSVIYNSGGVDMLGGLYNNTSTFSVDSVPKLSSTTFTKLSDVAPASFWSPFYP